MFSFPIPLFFITPHAITLHTLQDVTGCSLAYVEEGTTLIGFDVEDVCVEVTV